MKQVRDGHLYEFYLRGIAIGMRQINDQKLSEHEITNQQGRLLGLIDESLAQSQSLSRKNLQERMGLSGPSVTSLLNGLEKNGFIERRAAPDDGRAMELRVTPKGQGLIADMQTTFIETEERLLDGMSDIERGIFLELLRKAYANVGCAQRD